MRRWICPKCLKGANAPERLARTDSRRYCLKCSAKGTKLVERVCPSFEAAKVKRVEARKAKTVNRHERNAAMIREYKATDKAAPFRDSDSKIRAEFNRLRRLKSWGHKLSTRFTLRRSKVRHHRVSGHCWEANRIVITVGLKCDAAQIKTVLVHELAHAASRCREHHGDRFRSVMLDAAREAYGIGSVEPHSQCWEFDNAIADAIRQTEGV